LPNNRGGTVFEGKDLTWNVETNILLEKGAGKREGVGKETMSGKGRNRGGDEKQTNKVELGLGQKVIQYTIIPWADTNKRQARGGGTSGHARTRERAESPVGQTSKGIGQNTRKQTTAITFLT